MPSGAKKRKAAKKKKEQAANNIDSSTSNNPHGNDNSKSQDERDSDGGDVDSPASQNDHNHQFPHSQGGDEAKGAPSSVQSHVTEEEYVEDATGDAESTEKSGLDDVITVKIEKELGPKEVLESTDVPIQHVVHDKSSSSSSGGSSSSSSDDESQAFEKKSKEVISYSTEDKSATFMSEEVLKVAENETLGDVDGNFAVETTTVANLVKTVAEDVKHATDISANESVSDVVEAGLRGSEENFLPSSNGISRVELEGNDRKVFPSSGTAAESSNVVEKTQDSGPHDDSEKQPLVASTPPVVHRTSLLSCCGLFDVFTGSGR